MVPCESASSARIDAVFDDYQTISIRNAEREKRGTEMGNEYRSIRLKRWYLRATVHCLHR